MKSFQEIKKILPIFSLNIYKNEQTIFLSQKHLLFCILNLKKHINWQYSVLSCISGVDFLTSQYRFSIVYDFLSLINNSRLRLKIFVNEVSIVSSIVGIYKNANWWEREIWDLYGLYFKNHPDLRRILTDYGFEGFPMRKDFPLSGYVELRYDPTKKRIIIEPIELAQDFRNFVFETPWL